MDTELQTNQIQGPDVSPPPAARLDYMTGLRNMLGFFTDAEEIRQSIRKSGQCPAFLFFDFVGIKYYNRRNGFDAGNRLLKGFADLLTEMEGPERCCRYGQDHFGLITKKEGMEERLLELFDKVEQLNEGDSLPLRVGICTDNLGSVDINTLCDRTKIACDEIGDVRISTYKFYDESMLAAEEQQQYIINHLDQAIREGWICVYYQPIVRAITSKVCDDEALARWIDPKLGFLSPGDFIPILEEAKLIYKLDLCVLDQVLEKIRLQKERGYAVVPVSLNLSRSDFDCCDIVEEIRKRVDAAGIEHNLLTIEITESIIGKDFTFMKEQVRRFQDLGFAVWMDDFGSGYSSLDVLQQIRFDLIKFDMHFLQNFEESPNSRIILTELIKMASAMGVDMVCEGVETAAQAQFLQEVGCSKLQGYYYEKPISREELWNRYEKGLRIGFENSQESDYLDAVGRVNLYDLTIFSNDDAVSFQNFFNNLPMSIVEYQNGRIRLVRCNQSYRDFLARAFNGEDGEDVYRFTDRPPGVGSSYMATIKQCCLTGNRVFLDDVVSDGFVVHSFMKRIAQNPISGTYAVAIVVLYVKDNEREATFESLAKAMARDYFNIFQVDLDTERFVEYTSMAGSDNLTVERHGSDFFRQSRKDAGKLIYEEDRERFIFNFTRENVIHALDTEGAFALTYRIIQDGEPVYVLMKITRMEGSGNMIIIGVSNIDIQMKQREAMDRIRREQVVFTRLQALLRDYIAVYTVDLYTGHFIEYNAVKDYADLGLMKEGNDFFASCVEEGKRVIFAEDLPRYLRSLNRDSVLRGIEKYGVYTLQYRLVLDGVPTPVQVRVAKVREADGEKLIVGVTKTDDQVE